jgi:hypothetical protein
METAKRKLLEAKKNAARVSIFSETHRIAGGPIQRGGR